MRPLRNIGIAETQAARGASENVAKLEAARRDSQERLGFVLLFLHYFFSDKFISQFLPILTTILTMVVDPPTILVAERMTSLTMLGLTLPQ